MRKLAENELVRARFSPPSQPSPMKGEGVCVALLIIQSLLVEQVERGAYAEPLYLLFGEGVV